MRKILLLLIMPASINLVHAQIDTFNQLELDSLHMEAKSYGDSLKKMVRACDYQIKSSNDPAAISSLNIRRNELCENIDLNATNSLQIDLSYSKQHASSPQSLKLLMKTMMLSAALNLYDDYKTAYNIFPAELKASEDGNKMAEYLRCFNQSKEGSMAPQFSMIDVNGEKISLDDYKNKKYVLVDFWATWCKPCVGELPYILDLYKKYSKDGFEIISISSDKDLDKLKKAIISENIGEWKHCSKTENKSLVSTEYFVNAIPHKILIDKNGVIIRKWVGGSEKNKLELEKQLYEIFTKK